MGQTHMDSLSLGVMERNGNKEGQRRRAFDVQV